MREAFVAAGVAVIVGLVTNEVFELTVSWARGLARVAGRLWDADPDSGAERAEEFVAHIDERPGKLLKLATAINLLGGGLLRRGWTAQFRLRPSVRRGLAVDLFLAAGPMVASELIICAMVVLTRYDLNGYIVAAPGVVGSIGAVGYAFLISYGDHLDRRLSEDAMERLRREGGLLIQQNASSVAVRSSPDLTLPATFSRSTSLVRPYVLAPGERFAAPHRVPFPHHRPAPAPRPVRLNVPAHRR